ncbi:MAG: PilZ domain-containing protein [Desulfofustis sp.]|nr:PilZ domain-containing protein [Desulfofustis sp.]
MSDSTDASRQPETGSARDHERIRLVTYLRVFDGDSGLLLGHVVDVSYTGIQLVSHQPLRLNRTYALKLIMPKEVAGRFEMLIGAQSIWSRPDANPDFIITGLSFRSLSDDQREQINAIHAEFGRDTALSPVSPERPACNITHGAGR